MALYSLAFPDMFTSSRVKVIKDHAATFNNLRLLLLSDKKSLFGDPFYGTNLQKVIYSQNSLIIQDLVIDEIYTSIKMFMPQVQLSRNNIKVYGKGTELFADIECLNKLDYTPNLYTIRLTDTSQL